MNQGLFNIDVSPTSSIYQSQKYNLPSPKIMNISQPKNVSTPIKILLDTTTISNQATANQIYKFMKQQLELTSKNYYCKFSSIIKKQAIEINKLNIVILQNHKVIAKQADIIKKIGEREEMGFSTKSINQGAHQRKGLFQVREMSSSKKLQDHSRSPNRKISLTKKKQSKISLVTKEVSPFKPPLIVSQSNPSELISQIQKLNYFMQQSQYKQKLLQSKIGYLSNKIVQLQQKIKFQRAPALFKMRDTLEKYMLNSEEVLVKHSNVLRNNLEKLEKQQKSNKKNKQQFTRIVEQVEDFKEKIKHFSQRQWKYDTYLFEEIRDVLSKVIAKMRVIEEIEQFSDRKKELQNDRTKQKVGQLQNIRQNEATVNRYYQGGQGGVAASLRATTKQHLNSGQEQIERSQRLPHRKETQNFQNNSYVSSYSNWHPKTQTVPYPQNYNSHNQHQNEPEEQQSFGNLSSSVISDASQDEFYHPNLVTNSILQSNVDRFLQTLKKKQYQLPVHLEIDQTGYAKLCDTGMYILDDYEEGFEMDQGDLTILINIGAIYM